MAGTFHSLRISELRRETAEAVSIAFEVPPELEAAYAFQPGQYVTLRAAVNGEEQRRSYSICAAPHEGELRIAVKRVDDGVFSRHAHGELREGGAIDVMTPEGRFILPPSQGASRNIAFVAAGSGITPVIGMIKHLLETEPRSKVLLIYGNRRADGIIFRAALDELKDKHIERFLLHHVLSREERDAAVHSGRLDAEKIKALAQSSFGGARIDCAALCGPAPLIDEAAQAFIELGVPEAAVRRELFAPPKTQARRAAEKAERPAAALQGKPLGITLAGRAHAIDILDDETVIEAAQRHGLDVPFACKGGMCCTCRARITEGSVAMDANYSLEKWEMEAGFVLTCQSRLTTDSAKVDYDAL